MPEKKTRCRWAESSELMRQYHDEEWGVPLRDARALWELLMLEGFQAGLSWSVVLHKREAFQAAFYGFDPARVARMNEHDIERLLQDPRIIRSRAKIQATILGAQLFQQMERSGENFSDWLWSFVDDRPIQTEPPFPTVTDEAVDMSKALKKRGFKFVGPTIVYAFMQAAGMTNDHAEECFRRTPCTRLATKRR
ncbi:MAG: DNA-3-methyladenine glycosylase I [Micavibrio sp.]|nr:DNA-3-methyladenine glycosylase I [Micavibrio sp.]